MITKEPHYIIAIGASAGGLDEIITFFDNTLLDGVAYVIVQHLSSDFKSRMVELLSGHSKLFVEEAINGINIKSNHVYLIPNDMMMTTSNGKLYLISKENFKAPHLTINIFFNSLAISCGKKAIAVILSGLGTDGSEGIINIKKAGGMVIVRDPETTEFDGMPSSALATGVADFVLEPAAMPEAIENFIMYDIELTLGSQEDERIIVAIIELIKEQLPLDFSDYKLTTLLRRAKRRATATNFNSLEEYYEFLKDTPEELVALSKDFLISVTSFFRDPEAFEFIGQTVIPELLEKLPPGEELKMWIAGCATGEEVYSMAILISEHLTGPYQNVSVKLFATDLDSAALLSAGKGVYHWSSLKEVSPERLEKYFTRVKEGFKIVPSIRQMVIFAQHDLVKNPPYCNMHFISCRNLLIYMTPFLQKKIFSMLLFGLKVNGYLFLGSSENPTPIINSLEVANKKWRIYKNLSEKRAISFDTFSLPESINPKVPIPINDNIGKSSGNNISDAMNDLLADEMDHLAVCIDTNKQVVKSYGKSPKFLLQQNFNSNLIELLPEQLALAFNSISSQVFRTNKKAAAKGIPVNIEGQNILVSLSIAPLRLKHSVSELFMVIFREDTESTLDENYPLFNERTYSDSYVFNLEYEIKELKEKLQTAYERIDAYNENMQSFNEELISSNEEMQSTNEEMQSVNEELHTINADYQLKNKQLLEINDDLNNYFKSNINGQLFIDEHLALMKFSPGTVHLINLQENDIGRPLNHISTNIKMETMIDDIKQTIEYGGIIRKEIETNDGQWYQITTMPYVQQINNTRKGAIITFNDITQLKKTTIELDERNESLMRINADLDHFIHMVSHDLLEPLNNIESSISLMNEVNTSNAELMQFTNIINLSIRNFRSLIANISNIATLENNLSELETIDINEILNNIEWSLENKIRSSQAIINRKLEVKELYFSKRNLRSILYNIISNALKFTRETPPIVTINTKREGNNIVLSVEDNGIGIPKDELEKIFTIYGRLNLNIEGNGVGLYLARKIVNASGGELLVESEPGKGSNFTIRLKQKK